MSISLLVMLLAVPPVRHALFVRFKTPCPRSLGYVDNSSAEAVNTLQAMGTIISSCMVAILTFMVCLGLSALVYRAALGSQKELQVFNLGKVPSEQKVFAALLDIADHMNEQGKDKEDKFMKDLQALSVYDLSAVTRALDILADDLEMAVSQSMRSTSSSRRIAAGRRTTRGSRNSSEPAAIKAGPRQESLGAGCVLRQEEVQEMNEVSKHEERTESAVV